MNHSLSARSGASRSSLKQALSTAGYEVIPLKKAEEEVLASVPRGVPLTITASPAKGQDATVDLAVRLAAHGYSVAPHFSAKQIRDSVHLGELLARCRESQITEAFVVGGDPTDTPTTFVDALDLLRAMHELDHRFTDIGIGGHPEGHPSVSDEILIQALKDKAPLATHITTQIVFDPKVILAWAKDLHAQGIVLPIRVGVPGAVHRQKLLRVSSGLGIGESARFLSKQQKMLWRFFVPGGYKPEKIIRGLAPHLGQPDNNLAGFHVFTFNDLASTEDWRIRALKRLV